jgi:hypothetical protein
MGDLGRHLAQRGETFAPRQLAVGVRQFAGQPGDLGLEFQIGAGEHFRCFAEQGERLPQLFILVVGGGHGWSADMGWEY